MSSLHNILTPRKYMLDLQTTSGTPRMAEVDPALRRWFYPLIVLLISLPRAGRFPYKARREIEQAPSSRSSPEQIFRDFVSRFAFLCWTGTNPATIAACVVLAGSDGVTYVFTFNNRPTSELGDLENKIRLTLNMIHSSPCSDDAKRAILQHVLSCCVARIKGYLRAFARHLEDCIQACMRHNDADSTEIIATLQRLRSLTREALSPTDYGTEGVNVAATAELIWSVYDAYKSPVFDLVQKRVLTEERLASSTCWTELIHVAGRLMTYKQAIDVSLMVRELWPELFQDFHILMVPSGATATQVVNKKVMTTKEIIHKTTSDESMLQQLYSAAERVEHLQAFKLDQEIKEEWSRKPKGGIYVHAEINLLQYLEQTEGGTEESRFFQGIKYIGTSKPPCRLCSYFFREHPTDVEVGASHRNLYGAWLMPDIDPCTDTLKVARKIRDRLRDDLLQSLRGGQIDGRPHDSSGYTARRGLRSVGALEEEFAPTEASEVTDAGGPEAEGDREASSHDGRSLNNPVILSYLNAQVSLSLSRGIDPSVPHSMQNASGRRLASMAAQPRGSIQVPCPEPTDAGSDDEDDGGGVLLFKGRVNLRTGVGRH